MCLSAYFSSFPRQNRYPHLNTEKPTKLARAESKTHYKILDSF